MKYVRKTKVLRGSFHQILARLGLELHPRIAEMLWRRWMKADNPGLIKISGWCLTIHAHEFVAYLRSLHGSRYTPALKSVRNDSVDNVIERATGETTMVLAA